MFLEPAARHRRVEADRPVRATMVKPRSAGTRSASNICPVRQVAAGSAHVDGGSRTELLPGLRPQSRPGGVCVASGGFC